MIFLGNLIRLERVKNNLTQDQLADKVHYSKSKISRAETGHNNNDDPYELLTALSYALYFDFISIYKYSNKFADYTEYNFYFQLKEAIASANDSIITDFININAVELDNCDNKDIYFAKVYAFALLYKGDARKSLKLCLSSLNLEIDEIYNLVLKPYIQDDKLGVYTVLLFNLANTNNIDLAFILGNTLYNYFKKYLFNKDSFIEQSFFVKKLHILTINNLAHLYFVNKDYSTALIFCNEAIETANKFSISKSLNRIYKLKMEILYFLDDIANSKLYYDDSIVLSRILDDDDYIEIIKSTVEKTYPKLLE